MEFNRLDVSAKELVWDGPAAWVDRFGIGPPGPVSVIDSEITTLTASADKVLKVDAETPYLLNLEPHSYHDKDLARTLWYRHVALDYKHDLPVLTVLILLRKEANSPGLTGSYERQLPDGWLTSRYNYRVVRLWQEDPELVPDRRGQPDAAGPADQRQGRGSARPDPADGPSNQRRAQAAGGQALDRHAAADGVSLRGRAGDSVGGRSVEDMRDSTTYQAIVREGLLEGRREGRQEGRQEEARRLLLRHGTRRFGAPDAAVIAAVEAIDNVDRLESLTDRIFDATAGDWNDLLRGS